MNDFQKLRVGYVPLSEELEGPGDKRRFCHYARKRGVRFEIADPTRRYDVVVVSEAGDLSVWAEYEKGKVIFDFVDSYLAEPRTSPKALLRGLARYVTGKNRRLRLNHWTALEEMCRRSDAVICSTEEQRLQLIRLCPNVHTILDVHTMYNGLKRDYKAGEVFNLVWEGMPHNVSFFRELGGILGEIAANRPIALHLITALRYRQHMNRFGPRSMIDEVQGIFDPIYLYQWNEKTCPAILISCDMALIPVPLENPFAAGKPENKLLLLWRLGLPVVVSATPAYARTMSSANLAMACSTPIEWKETLTRYISDEHARQEAGSRGRAFVEANHDEQQLLARWDALFESVLSR